MFACNTWQFNENSMWRHYLILFPLVFVNTAQLAAQVKVVTLEAFREFDGYQRDEAVGSSGHMARDSWFTGRWYCAVITAGVIGQSKHIPFAAPVRPRIKERVVAISAVDSESDARLCVSIVPEFQPMWIDEFDFRIQSKDSVCFIAWKSATPDANDNCILVSVSLSDRTVSAKQLSVDAARRRLQNMAVNVPSSRRLPLLGGAFSEKGLGPALAASTIGNGSGLLDQSDLSHEPDSDATRYLAPGSQVGRLTYFDIIAPGRFAISECDQSANGRQYWLLSEASLEPDFNVDQLQLGDICFPRLLLPPLDNFIFAVEIARSSGTVFAITNGRLHKLWQAPDDYWIHRLEVSENEQYAAVQLVRNPGKTDGEDLNVSIDAATGNATILSWSRDMKGSPQLIGVTNQGMLVHECRDTIYIERRDSKVPQQVVRLIRVPEDP